MKKILAIVLALCMIFSFAACGSKADPAPNGGSGNEEPALDESKLSGETKESVYENEYLNLKVTLPAGWSFYDKDQIAAVNNMTVEAYEGTSVAESVSKAGQYMTMMMASPAGCSFNLLIQTKDKQYNLFTDEQLFTNSESEMKKQFESSGISMQKYEVLTLTIGGENRTVLHMILDFGVLMDEYQLWYRTKNGNYMGVLTLAVPDGTDPQPYLECIGTMK
jgi:hypothetical protein